MATDLFPTQMQDAVLQGFNRVRNTRKARAMFVKQYCGQYYMNDHGITGGEPLNLIYHTIRSTVPIMVTRSPQSIVSSPIVEYQDYAYLLGLALNELNANYNLNMKEVMRYAIVDALFTMAIFKTGIADSGQVLNTPNGKYDNGMIYTENVSLDNWVLDPHCTSLETSAFEGDRYRIPRQILLDNDAFDHDLVMELPKAGADRDGTKTAEISRRGLGQDDMALLQDHVDVVQLYVHDAEAIITIPDPTQHRSDKFLAIQDYFGPKGGPYDHLKISQPVPDNPLPIAAIGIWYDLHMMSNEIMQKTMEQAGRQKTIMAYNPANADEANDMKEADDGDMIACDPSTVTPVNLGGEHTKDNLGVLQNIQFWANYMAGNPDQAAGNKSSAGTATEASILQSNSSISASDAQDMIYDCGSELLRKQAWFIHHDPLINVPIPWRRPNDGKLIQLTLTPEQRRGDHENYVFKIKPKSMTAPDPSTQSKRVMEFTTNVMPSLTNTAMMMAQQGIPFNLQKAITDLAEQMGISDDIQMWFQDPEFGRRIMLLQNMGPQPTGKSGGTSQAGIMQQGGFPMQRDIRTNQQDANANSQGGAAPAQSMNQGTY